MLSLEQDLFNRFSPEDGLGKDEKEKIVGIMTGVLKEEQNLAPDEINARVVERFFNVRSQNELDQIRENPKTSEEFEKVAYAVHDVVNQKELPDTDYSSPIEDFIEAYRSLEEFSPTKAELKSSSLAKLNKKLQI